MQGLARAVAVDGERKQAVLGALADGYCRQILRCTLGSPRSAAEISRGEGIPISTVYRRLQALCDARLVAISGSISEDGKKYFLYRSRTRHVSLEWDLGDVDVRLEPNPPAGG